MRARHLGWSVLAVAMSLAPLGCEDKANQTTSPAASASAAAPSASASTSASAAAVKPRSPFVHHGGLAAGLFHAAQDLPDLSPSQEDSLGKIETDLKTDDDGMRTATKTFRSDLAAGVRAGKLDTAKLSADDAAVDKAIADHQAKEAQALDSLHGLLTPAQRTSVVAAVKAKQAEHEAPMMTWMKEADGGARDFAKHRLDRLTADLSLDAGQQKQVAALLGKGTDAPDAKTMQARWDERRARSEALFTAFAKDTMDAKSLDLAIMPGKSAHEPMDHMTTFFTKLLPILHPDQQQKLAASLDRPFGGMHHGPSDGAHEERTPTDDMAFPFTEPMDRGGEGAAAR